MEIPRKPSYHSTGSGLLRLLPVPRKHEKTQPQKRLGVNHTGQLYADAAAGVTSAEALAACFLAFLVSFSFTSVAALPRRLRR